MEIRWFSELPLDGKVDRDFTNMRTEFAWFVAQDAIHSNLFKLSQLADNSVDIGIIIIPKKVEPFLDLDIVYHLKRVCKKYGFMQEGPSWYFQSLPLVQSFWFYNIMLNADFVLAHNDTDKSYYEGLLDKPVFINPTLMIEDSIKDIKTTERNGIMLGGNLVRWYGGFNSLIAAKESNEKIYAPQMGRMEKEELSLEDINHLPYMQWTDWIKALSRVKFAIHLNPNSIGGTFSLNCAYLGIPCIGNQDSNTQNLCFPSLSIRPDNMKAAKTLVKMLSTNETFYNNIVKSSKENYKKYFSEQVYKSTWKEILNKII